MLLVTDESGQATFEGKELNNGGLWDVTPTIEAETDSENANVRTAGTTKNWYLTSVERVVNNDTAVLLDSVDNGYGLWRNTNDSLRNRLGSLVQPSDNVEGGMWGRMIRGRLGGSDFHGNYNLYQLGYDKAADAKSTYGFAIDKGTGSADYAAGSEKNDFVSGSIYGVWSADDGSYTNAVARIGQFSNDINSYGDYPDEGSYKNKAYSLSVEYGKTFAFNQAAGTFITPEMQLVAGRLGSTNYTTERNSQVRLGGLNSFIGRAGLTLGQKNNQGDELYLKAAVLREFGGSRNIEMLAANGEVLSGSRNYSDTWLEVGVGGNVKLGRNTNLYGSVEKTFGADIQKKWQLNAGMRWEF